MRRVALARLRRHLRRQRRKARAPQRRQRWASFGRWMIEHAGPIITEAARRRFRQPET